MMEAFKLTGIVRDKTGKEYVKSLRKQGLVPCELYGKGKNIHFSVDPFDIRNLIYTPEFKIADLTLDGNSYRCFVKEIQYARN